VNTPPPDPPTGTDCDAEFFGLPVSDPASANASRDVVELAVSSFMDGLRRGTSPSVEDFAQRYPEHSEEIREILPLVAAMESWKTAREAPGGVKSIPAAIGLERLGEFRLVREIGRGGMGVVYEAVQEPGGRRVAFKLLPWRLPETSPWRQRFLNEARTTARLRHPHIVPVYEFGEQQGWCYYVMQLVEGLSLDRIIRLLKQPAGAVSADDIQRAFAASNLTGRASTSPSTAPQSSSGDKPGGVLRRDSWQQIAAIGIQAADALRFAHARGTLHLDVKPANLLLDPHGSVWLADFGVASQRDDLLGGSAGHLAGTLPYAAPEQIDGLADERSDLYSLGTTLYELCTLRPPFEASTRTKLVAQMQTTIPPRPREVNRLIPVELERIILKATDRTPERRYQSADELLEALWQFIQRKQTTVSSSGWGDLFGRLLRRDGS
jgi:serine/threonine protein kinase